MGRNWIVDLLLAFTKNFKYECSTLYKILELVDALTIADDLFKI